MHRKWGTALIAWLALLAGPAAACTLHAELLRAPAGLDGPPLAAPVHARALAEPGALARVPLRGRGGEHWLRLRCAEGAVPAGEGWRLVVAGARRLDAVLFYPPGAATRHPLSHAPAADAGRARQRELELPQGWPMASTGYLRLHGQTTEPLLLRLERGEVLGRERDERARLGVAVFALLTLMATLMTAAYLAYRDLLYLSYAGYLACLGLFLLLLGGHATLVPGIAAFAEHGPTGQWSMATLAVALQLVFTRRILELERWLPRAALVLRVLFWLHVGLLMLLLIGRSEVHDWYPTAANGLLLASAPIVTVIALQAARRGAAYANYYLAGWLPLLAIAALAAANQLGLVAAPWAPPLLPLAAAFETVVLAIALSQHAAHRHRIARLARHAGGRDPLTGALTGEALRRMLESWQQLGALGARDYTVLLLDLDDFGRVNAEHGRAVGDAALQQVLVRIRAALRPDDVVARIDGDSFAVVSECEADDTAPVARRIADSIGAAPLQIDGHSLALSASVGLARVGPGEPVDALLQRARVALTRARRIGRNAVSLAAEPTRKATAEIESAES